MLKKLIPICFALLCGCSEMQNKMIIDCHAIQSKYVPQYHVLPVYNIPIVVGPINITPKQKFPAIPKFDSTNWAEIQQQYYQDCVKLR